ncbi:hypothetical protein [Kribbella catacumbae]|uniref:hypothetical protein n=1 Tax=Kribbella catacumbae TaxID=460086 RepID=UPI0003803516|nr:hypothetical protein [Kribbella catacumbae]
MTDDRIRVGPNSPAAYALDPAQWEREDAERVSTGRMQWSLGSELADLLWMVVPESRSALAAQAGKELAAAAQHHRFLTPASYGELADLTCASVLVPALAEGQRDVVVRALAVLRRVISEVEGDFRWEAIDDRVIRMLEKAGHGEVLAVIDPELMELVRETRRRLGQD